VPCSAPLLSRISRSLLPCGVLAWAASEMGASEAQRVYCIALRMHISLYLPASFSTHHFTYPLKTRKGRWSVGWSLVTSKTETTRSYGGSVVQSDSHSYTLPPSKLVLESSSSERHVCEVRRQCSQDCKSQRRLLLLSSSIGENPPEKLGW
jgi:hypothetical protein